MRSLTAARNARANRTFDRKPVVRAAVVALVSLLAPSWVLAQAPTQPAQMHLGSELSQPGQRTFHYHDGFYLRGSVGGGRTSVVFSADSARAEAAGVSLGADLLVGVSPSPGIALGGGVNATLTPAAVSPSGGNSQGLTTVLIGPFVDGFPRVNGGWHLGALAGLAATHGSNAQVGTGVGFGGSVWGGYAGWVAPDVSLGGTLRLSGSQTFHSPQGDSLTGGSLGWLLAFTVLYH